MRKLMVAVMAVAAAGMVTTGCSRKAEVQRQEVAETRIDLTKAKKEKQPDATHTRVEAEKDPASTPTLQAEAEKNPALAPTLREMDGYKQVDEDRTQAHAEALMDLASGQGRDIHTRMNPDEMSATGGSGLSQTGGEVVSGTVQAVTDKSLTIIISTEENRLMRFMADERVPVMRDSQPITMQSLKAGDEVRASYQVDATGLRVLRGLEVTRVSNSQPAMLPK